MWRFHVCRHWWRRRGVHQLVFPPLDFDRRYCDPCAGFRPLDLLCRHRFCHPRSYGHRPHE